MVASGLWIALLLGSGSQESSLDELLLWSPWTAPPTTGHEDVVRLPLELDETRCHAVLRRHSLRDADLEVTLSGASGLTPWDVGQLPPPATYRGWVVGPDGGQREEEVAASVDRRGRWTLFVRGPKNLTLVQPMTDFDPSADESAHVQYNARDVHRDVGIQCGNSSFPAADDLLGLGQSGGSRAAGSTQSGQGPAGSRDGALHQAELAFEADFKYYKLLNKDAVAVIQDIEKVMNAVDLIYQRDVEITHEITHYLIRTDRNNNYSERNGLLFEMQAYWNTNLPHVARDTAHLMTGYDVSGGLIGQAWIGVICKVDRGYGFSKSRFTSNFGTRTLLTAHELGHNWKGMHCDARAECKVMCATIGGCDAGQSFVDYTAAAISDFRDTLTCLEKVDREATLPLYDSFETGLVDHPAWSYQRGVQVVSDADDEPNGDFALELNSTGFGETREDELRTGLLDIPAGTPMHLTFFSRWETVPAGEELLVDVYASDRTWQPLLTVTSTGTDPTAWAFQRAALHPFAWDELRVRFRVSTSDPAARWLLDDVQIRPAGLAHTITPLLIGQPVEFAAHGATPGAPIYFLYSLQGLGDGPCFGNDCLDLLAPIEFLGLRTADGLGMANIGLTIPAGTPPTDYFGQLVTIDGGSFSTSHAVPTRVR